MLYNEYLFDINCFQCSLKCSFLSMGIHIKLDSELCPYLNQLAISLNDGMDTILGGVTILAKKFIWTNC